MTATQDTIIAASPDELKQPRGLASALAWPNCAWLCGILLGLLYLPVLQENFRDCLRNEDFSHCLFIFPIAIGLIWLQRADIRRAARMPEVWGLGVLGGGLLMMGGSYLLSVKFVALWSLIPVLAGAILALHGRELWRIARFSVCLLFWAGPIPNKLYFPVSSVIQAASTRCAAWLMESLGYTILRTGNLIEIPGHVLEVADVCSGFKKLIALTVFALIYGYMFAISPMKRFLLLLSAFPIALVANALRISALTATLSAGGDSAFHIAHNLAEIGALVLSFMLFNLMGRLLGCTKLRFLP